MKNIERIDPVFASRLEQAVGLQKERGLQRAAKILRACEDPALAAKVAEAVRMVQAIWPGAMVWEVRSECAQARGHDCSADNSYGQDDADSSDQD